MKKILVVEDNELHIDILSILLNRPDWAVSFVYDAESGLDAAMHNPPDLMLIDIVLPNMSGLELAQELKNRLATENIPMIAVTAYAASEAMYEARDAGFDDFINKPFDGKKLVNTINHYLGASDFAGV